MWFDGCAARDLVRRDAEEGEGRRGREGRTEQKGREGVKDGAWLMAIGEGEREVDGLGKEDGGRKVGRGYRGRVHVLVEEGNEEEGQLCV